MIKIKRIDIAEAESVYELFDKYRVFYKQQSDLELAKHFISERLKNNESIIFVAFDEVKNKSVGFAQLFPKYSSAKAVKNWILNDLYVDADYRQRGIGSDLIKAAIKFAGSTDSQFVQLSTQTDNYIAQSLYHSIGFIKQEPESDFYTYRINV